MKMKMICQIWSVKYTEPYYFPKLNLYIITIDFSLIFREI